MVTRPRRQRRRRLITGCVVFIGLLVGADYGAAALFEHQVAARVQAQFRLAGEPSVTVHGFPFLTQAVIGDYRRVTIDAAGLPVSEVLRDVRVHAELSGIHAPLRSLLSGSADQVSVARVDGELTVTAPDVQRAIERDRNEVVRVLTGFTVDPLPRPAGGTMPELNSTTSTFVRLCAQADIVGLPTSICVSATIRLVDDLIRFEPQELEIRNAQMVGRLPPVIQDQVLSAFATTLDPGDLPFQIEPTAVRVEPGNLTLSGTLRDVSLDAVLGRT